MLKAPNDILDDYRKTYTLMDTNLCKETLTKEGCPSCISVEKCTKTNQLAELINLFMLLDRSRTKIEDYDVIEGLLLSCIRTLGGKEFVCLINC